MNPEPLTKEKIKKYWNEIERIHAESTSKTDRIVALNLANLIGSLQEDVKSAVNWLLKEIEKEKKIAEKRINEDYFKGLRNGYIVAIELIKKAFEGVRE